MKFTKYILNLLVCLILISALTLFTFADEEGSFVKKTDTNENGAQEITDPAKKIDVIVDGEKLTFDVDSGFPYIEDPGRTMFPLRKVAETLGSSVAWRQSDDSVHIFRDGISITLPIGQNIMSIGKIDVMSNVGYVSAVQKYELDSPTWRNNEINRTFIPFRALCEALGFNVDWNAGERTVVITNPKGKEETKNGSGYNEKIALEYVDFEGLAASSGGGYLGHAETLEFGAVKIDFGILNGGPLLQGKAVIENTATGEKQDAVKNGYTFLKPGDYKVNVDGLTAPEGYAINKNANFKIEDLTADAQTVKLWSKTVQEIKGLSDIENLEKEVTLKPVIEPADAVDKTIEYSSSDSQVVTVDDNGTLKPVGFGTAKITAKAKDAGGKAVTINVTVPVLLSVDSTKTVKAGDLSIPRLSQMTGLLTLESSDPSVASVQASTPAAPNSEIVLTGGKKAGTATITVKFENITEKEFKVVVSKPVSAIKVFDEGKETDTVKATLNNGKFVQGAGQKDLTINVEPKDATDSSISIPDTWNHDILKKVEKTDKGIHIELKPQKGETTITVKAGAITKDIKVIVE